MIPLVDLKWQHARISEAVESGMHSVMAETSFILGPDLEAFEAEYAEYCGVRHVLGVGSGTDAIELSVRALGLPPGSKVVMPANTFIATGLAVMRAGLEVQLVDVEEETFLIDVDRVADAVGSETSAVVPVHLFGRLVDVDLVRSAAPGLPIIEDAAQSHGAVLNGCRSGSLGELGATSFYPGKNLGAYGDAGAVTTDDADLMMRVRHLRNWGSDRKYDHPTVGFNSRLDTIQAVVLREKLRWLDEWNDLRRKAARVYAELLTGHERIIIPEIPADDSHVFHLYVVRVPERNRVLSSLHEAGVGAGIHYPKPMHQHGALSILGHRPGDFPVVERLASEILSLPLFPGITTDQQQRVVEALEDALS